MRGNTRCVEGTLYRHEPQHDDPAFEMAIGKCPECEGFGCDEYESIMAAVLHHEEMVEQAQRCGCRGSDEYCVCQNAPDRTTRKKRLHNAVGNDGPATSTALSRQAPHSSREGGR